MTMILLPDPEQGPDLLTLLHVAVLRHQGSLTDAGIAKDVGVSRRTISRWMTLPEMAALQCAVTQHHLRQVHAAREIEVEARVERRLAAFEAELRELYPIAAQVL